MATLSVRNLSDGIHRALRVRAAHNERSVEAEVREILAQVLTVQPGEGIGTVLQRFGKRHGGIHIETLKSSPVRSANFT